MKKRANECSTEVGRTEKKIISVFNTCITAQIPILKYDYDEAMTTR